MVEASTDRDDGNEGEDSPRSAPVHLHDELRVRRLEVRDEAPRAVAQRICGECGAVLSEEPLPPAA
jgi:hypothetical protein